MSTHGPEDFAECRGTSRPRCHLAPDGLGIVSAREERKRKPKEQQRNSDIV
jgi:hypothetical protein